METKTNYTLVGLFVLLLTIASFGIGGWLISDTSYRQYNAYYAYMSESVAGLNKDAPVKYNGVDVGYVSNISINPNNTREVQLLLKIQSSIPISESVSARMISQGLTGLRFVELQVEETNAPIIMKGDDKYPVIKTQSSLMVRLDQTLSHILRDFDNISDSLQRLLDEDAAISLRNSLTHIETITAELAKNIDAMTKGINSAQTMLANTANVSREFPELAKVIKETLSEVNQVAKQINQTSASFAFAANQSGSAAQQVNEQVIPDINQLVGTLNFLSEQFTELVQAVENQPSMIVRGRQTGKLGPGE